MVTKEPGNKSAFWYFDPKPIPRELILEPATVNALSKADAALGRLSGLAQLIPDIHLLLGSYLTQEAVASSRIEGTEASLSEVLVSEASESPYSDDIAEVERYLAAARLGSQLVDDLPITQRLIKELHSTLLSGVRGKEKLPGELRRSPVWVGSPTAGPDTAIFVPPLPSLLGELLTDWEKFVNESSSLPVLVRCALMHYQFETIHPFLDGNGRIGRLLVNLMLISEARLSEPLLYLSGYLETHRREYYTRLQSVRERGEIQEWLQFFFTAIEHQANDGVQRTEALVELRERMFEQTATARTKIQLLIPLILTNPFVSVPRIRDKLGIPNQTARTLIGTAVELGWLREVGRFGIGGRVTYVCEDVLVILEVPPLYD